MIKYIEWVLVKTMSDPSRYRYLTEGKKGEGNI